MFIPDPIYESLSRSLTSGDFAEILSAITLITVLVVAWIIGIFLAFAAATLGVVTILQEFGLI